MASPPMLSRRLCLRLLASGTLAAPAALHGAPAKPLAGVFPIVQTPFSDDDRLDTKVLGEEIRFCDRIGVHGVVWPQLASEYADLSLEERFAGMEVVAGIGKELRPAVVLGVQGPDIATALKYTRHAEKLAPDAIIALPPPAAKDPRQVIAYYKAIGEHTSRPLFAQTIGNMPVDTVLEMAATIPNFRYVKDEAGHTLSRISEYRHKNSGNIKGIFTGGHGRTMIDELMRGATGTMPAVPFGDLYVNVWDAWNAGNRASAFDQFSKLMLLVTQVAAYGIPSIKYILHKRGVFPNANCRSGAKAAHFDGEARTAIDAALAFVKPSFRVS